MLESRKYFGSHCQVLVDTSDSGNFEYALGRQRQSLSLSYYDMKEV
jgi:hypothetical protein